VLVNDAREASSGPADTVPRFASRSAADLARIEALVRTAVGVDSARGDAVSVVSLPFDTPKVTRVPEVTPGLAEQVQQVQRPVLTGAGLVLAFALALIAMRAVRAAPRAPLAITAPAAVAEVLRATQQGTPIAQMARAPQLPAAPRFTFRSADTEVRDKVIATVDENPDGAARLVKAWIKEG